jgi:hypothetical protein
MKSARVLPPSSLGLMDEFVDSWSDKGADTAIADDCKEQHYTKQYGKNIKITE